jgi:tRNA A-37 threonylcarbamoyl transferase component Bud32
VSRLSTDQTVIAYPEGERTILALLPSEVVDHGIGRPPEGYELGSLLGRGGEGEVYEARQLSFGRTVAIKSLRAGRDDQRQRVRFQAEAAITALLEHPNIIPVHDLCVDAAGVPQLVMKRVSGRTWRAIIESGSATGDEHVEILLKVCDALEFAHGQGMLHRDLKPENVMVGEHREVLVMDWGCAAHLGPQSPHPLIPLLSNMSGTSGTPSYMSPEQARAEHTACGPWSDVYLLGACLYHALAGSAPRGGNDVRGILASAMCGDPLDEPGVRAGKRVSLELAAIAMAALQPDLSKRTPTVTAFAKGLRRYLEHREVLDLVADARREHEVARAGGTNADDSFRRAICTVEQAVRLWPELLSARRLQVAVGLDAARHACAAGAVQQAQRLAEATQVAAKRLGDAEAMQQASRVAAQASAQELLGQRRERHQRALRLGTAGAVICAVLSLSIGMLLVWRESQRTTLALAAAEANLAQANHERQAREAGERIAMPALLAQARELAQQRRFAEGIPLVETARGFAPTDPQPLIRKAQLLIALARRAEAVVALDAALALQSDADVVELRRWCTESPVDVEARLAAVLVRMGARAEASALNLAADKRLALALAHLRQAWPALPENRVLVQSDGTLSLNLIADVLRIDSLEPLRGLPIAVLDITGQLQVRDLGPLRDLPLKSLTARGTGVRDFSIVRGLPLRRLYLGWYPEGFTLAMVRGLELEALDAPGSGSADLSPLAGMPVRELRLYGCDKLSDLSALKTMPLELLTLEAPKSGVRTLTDLSPLAGKSLAEISLPYQLGVSSVEALRGQPLHRVVLHGTSVSDLSPVMGPALRHIATGLAPVSDLRPLLSTKVEIADFSPQNVRHGLDSLLSLPSLRRVCGYQPDDFQRWQRLAAALAEANPGFPWSITAVFKDGHVSEARVLYPLASLAPLAQETELRVLHLVGTTSDVRPLSGLRLVELVWSPSKDVLGVEVLRQMSSLQRIGSSAQALQPAAEYWRDYASGRR